MTKYIVIPIYNQTRQSICFSIDETIRIRIGDDSPTQPDGLRESPPPKLFCNGFVVEGQDPHADFGCRIVEPSGVESSIRRHNIDHIARDQLADDLLDITGIDPEMPQCLDRACTREANTPARIVMMKGHGVLIQ